LHRSKAFQQQKQYDEALSDLSRAVELSPKNVEVYQRRVDIYKEIFSSAIADKIVSDLTKVIELNPNLDFPYADRGFSYLVLKKHDEAYKDVCAAISRNPKNARYHLEAAVTDNQTLRDT
jgi:tetratricopeptide (TPR) repeat protein